MEIIRTVENDEKKTERFSIFKDGKEISYIRVNKIPSIDDEEIYYLDGVFTEESERCNGYATKLIEHIKLIYINSILKLYCFKRYTPFYNKLGFIDCSKKHHEYDGKFIGGVVAYMELKIQK